MEFHSNKFTRDSLFRDCLTPSFHFSKAVSGKQSQLSLTFCVMIAAALCEVSRLGISVAISFTTFQSFVVFIAERSAMP